MSPVPSSRCYLQRKTVRLGRNTSVTSNAGHTELSCSHVLMQRSGFGLRTRSQFCSLSWRFSSSLLPIIFFTFQEEALREVVLTSCRLPGGSGKQPRGSGSRFTNSPRSQDAESSLRQRFLVHVRINFHSWSSFRVDAAHTVGFVLLQRFSYCILFL